MNEVESTQIIQLIAEGKTNKEIADCTGLTAKAISKRIERMLRRNKCKNRAELAVKMWHKEVDNQ